MLDGVGLHERDDHEAAAVGQCPDLERGPGQRRESARRRDGGEHGDRDCRVDHEGRACAEDALSQELGGTAGQQGEHQPGADQHGDRGARHDVDGPAARVGGTGSARADEVDGGAHCDRCDDGASAGAEAANPSRW